MEGEKRMIKFGPSGNSESFYAEGYTHTEEAAIFAKERGLDCFEYSFGRGVRMTEEKARSIGAAFEKAGVELSVMADGEALASMSPTDLYALFGNALDNALEAARKVEEGRGRYISVVVRRAAGMVVVHVENSFAGEAPTFVDGLPQTTKADRANHGFGTLSVRRIAERYGGTATMACQGQVFTLDVLLASTA